MKIQSEKTGDIHFISCLIQDSISMLNWIKHNNFVFEIYLNRFCWEKIFENDENIYRKNSILYISNAKEVFLKNPPSQEEFVTLLACLVKDSNKIKLVFNQGFEVLIKGEDMFLELKDVSVKWSTDIIPISL